MWRFFFFWPRKFRCNLAWVSGRLYRAVYCTDYRRPYVGRGGGAAAACAPYFIYCVRYLAPLRDRTRTQRNLPTSKKRATALTSQNLPCASLTWWRVRRLLSLISQSDQQFNTSDSRPSSARASHAASYAARPDDRAQSISKLCWRGYRALLRLQA